MYLIGFVCCVLSLVALTSQESSQCASLTPPSTRPPGGCRWAEVKDANNGCPKHQLICSDPNADLTCFAPKRRGPCESNIDRFYFNPISGACLPFFYGGCGGNANRFVDRKQCQDQCYKYLLDQSVKKTAETLRAATSCANVKCRPGFSCQLMRSRRAEVTRCVPDASHAALQRCTQPIVAGSCTRRFIRYYYDREHGECRRFEYSGCGGNANNFDTKEECEKLCDKVLPCPSVRLAPLPTGCRYEQTIGTDFCVTPVQVCTLGENIPSVGENCPPAIPPTAREGCLVQNSADSNGCPIKVLACFSGACEGNPCAAGHSECGRCINELGKAKGYRCERDPICEKNERDILCLSLTCDNFKECQVKDGFPQCIAVAGVKTVTENVQGSTDDESDKIAAAEGDKAIRIDQTDDCDLSLEKGPCSQAIKQWYFDPRDRICREFTYGGCGGNANRFATQQICRHSCSSKLTSNVCPEPVKKSESFGCRNELTTDGNGCRVYRLHCDQGPPATIGGGGEACKSHNCTACQQCVARRDPCVGAHCLPYECTGGCDECETCTSSGKCLSTRVICSTSWRDFDPCAGQTCPRMPTAVCQPDACNCRKPLWVLPNDRVLSFGEC